MDQEQRILVDSQWAMVDGQAVAKEARLWLRSEKVKNLHLVNTNSRPYTNEDIENELLSGGGKGALKAVFSHEGALAVCESDEALFESKKERQVGTVIEELAELLPVSKICGAPVADAVRFINLYEDTHRSFYGGIFGVIDPRRTSFHLITQARTFADGVVSSFSGADVTAEMS